MIITKPDYWMEMSMPLFALTHGFGLPEVAEDEQEFNVDFDPSCEANGGHSPERYVNDKGIETVEYCSGCGKTLELLNRSD